MAAFMGALLAPGADESGDRGSTGTAAPSAPIDLVALAIGPAGEPQAPRASEDRGDARSSPPGAARAFEAPVLGDTEDPAARQLLVQSALVSDKEGLATRAAVAIGRCLSLEAAAERARSILHTDVFELIEVQVVGAMEPPSSELRKCQALDAFSRAQWLPLLQRGLAEGRVGDAHAILSAFLGSPQLRQVAEEVKKPLRADAWSCHEGSMMMFYALSTGGPSPVADAESEALWIVYITRLAAQLDMSGSLPAREELKPDRVGDPAEVQRIVDTILARCPPMPGTVPGTLR